MVLISQDDYGPHPNLCGLIVHLRVRHHRELKAVVLARRSSALGILAWTRLLPQCTRLHMLRCRVWLNGERVQGSEQINLAHGDYLRVEATDGHVEAQRATLRDIQEPHLPPQVYDSEHYWPKPPHLEGHGSTSSVAVLRGGHQAPIDRLHADYWIYMSWWLIASMVILLLPDTPAKQKPRRRRRIYGGRSQRVAVALILLIACDRILPVATLQLALEKDTLADPPHNYEEHAIRCITQVAPHVPPDAQLRPHGNPGDNPDPTVYSSTIAKDTHMYRPVATPARSAQGRPISLERLLAPVETDRTPIPIPTPVDRSQVSPGLDAPRIMSKHDMYMGFDFLDRRHLGLLTYQKNSILRPMLSSTRTSLLPMTTWTTCTSLLTVRRARWMTSTRQHGLSSYLPPKTAPPTWVPQSSWIGMGTMSLLILWTACGSVQQNLPASRQRRKRFSGLCYGWCKPKINGIYVYIRTHSLFYTGPLDYGVSMRRILWWGDYAQRTSFWLRYGRKTDRSGDTSRLTTATQEMNSLTHWRLQFAKMLQRPVFHRSMSRCGTTGIHRQLNGHGPQWTTMLDRGRCRTTMMVVYIGMTRRLRTTLPGYNCHTMYRHTMTVRPRWTSWWCRTTWARWSRQHEPPIFVSNSNIMVLCWQVCKRPAAKRTTFRTATISGSLQRPSRE